MEEYTYYIIQVGDQFIANQYYHCDVTNDEEQALAFTSLEEATFYANVHNGIVEKRCVDDCELQMLTEQHYMEYVKLSVEERREISIFCREIAE